MSNKHFDRAFELVRVIKDAGYDAFIVGGAVRDYLLNQTSSDIDIASSASPEVIQSLFDKVITVGIEHGTVIVRHEGESFEITTFRTESNYSDYRHPDHVEFVESIILDLSRRDLTINAIAMDDDQSLIDPFDGKFDIDNRIIRAVGSPAQRFDEDPLRILRAIRFSSQLNFTIEPKTFQDISKKAPLIQELSVERIAIELEKLFKGRAYKRAIRYGIDLGVFSYLPVFNRDQAYLKFIQSIDQPVHQLIDLFAFISLRGSHGVTIRDFVRAYKLSNKTLNNGQVLIQSVKIYKRYGLSQWFVYQLPSHLDQSFIWLIDQLMNHAIDQSELAQLREQLPIQTRTELTVSGHDLMEWFPNKGKGRWMRAVLNEIEHAVVTGDVLNDKNDIKDWLL
ncbi:tRNA nucleotidyltransferase (CCA-adding enzyme) [Pelagirhabdus alkalitolerans]|uniref:CCA-adding enzyme n=1 Tax=Pelagirhabdus alkalitolerans TaxID=1612202 RepID=A0A1G6HAI2_9BACI|nr:CCA tRNA nucleotidyltransferase [Pelagirhabdus alkalitolerans]SDB91154.1 tRNA nucleotidyltransferase (CCA-adding enzyme) [Pelagirhabdus alkalitolerans]